MKEIIINQIKEDIKIKQAILANADLLGKIDEAAHLIIESFRKNGKLLIAGNGGSAADAQHIAGEMINKFYIDRAPLPAVALTTDTSVITSISNDFSAEEIFSKQVAALGCSDDIFLAISTSGNSKNILSALTICSEKNITSIALTGHGGGKMKNIASLCIEVPSDETPRIQEAHMVIYHIICYLVENELFGKA